MVHRLGRLIADDADLHFGFALLLLTTALTRTSTHTMSLPRLVIVGGSGRVALAFSKAASASYAITSLVRSKDHFDAISSTGAHPKLLSIEDASVEQVRAELEGADAVLFSAGAGGKGAKERTKAVDELGAIKVSMRRPLDGRVVKQRYGLRR